jgi:uncharacterized membrane protein
MSIIDLVWMRKSTKKSKRFIELDLLRGLAILLMIFGHILWDLDHFNLVPMNNVIYATLQKTVPPLFFLLVGMSIIAGRKKKQLTPEGEKKYNEQLLVRGLKIFNLGVFLTIASLLVMPESPVYFGVLHCIGLSVVLCAFFLKYRAYNLVFGVAILLAGLAFSNIHINNPTIIHLAIGIHPAGIFRYTVDYFPLVPWFGVTLLGIAIGDFLYCGETRRFRMPDISKYRPAKLFSWVGQHSLIIYLVHQPVIAGALYVFVRFI